MNYSLAKQLKAKGILGDLGIKDVDGIAHFSPAYPKGLLEKLIEACGQDFEALTYVDNYNPKAGEKTMWRAYSEKVVFIHDIEGRKVPCEPDCCGYETGKTPTEAVAKLWLKLNEKPIR